MPQAVWATVSDREKGEEKGPLVMSLSLILGEKCFCISGQQHNKICRNWSMNLEENI